MKDISCSRCCSGPCPQNVKPPVELCELQQGPILKISLIANNFRKSHSVNATHIYGVNDFSVPVLFQVPNYLSKPQKCELPNYNVSSRTCLCLWSPWYCQDTEQTLVLRRCLEDMGWIIWMNEWTGWMELPKERLPAVTYEESHLLQWDMYYYHKKININLPERHIFNQSSQKLREVCLLCVARTDEIL